MKIIKLISFLLLMSGSLTSIKAQKAISPQKLRVLYVGGSANWENDYFKGDSIAKAKDVQRRMASFESMLKRYFTSVKVINATAYQQDMSEEYDVTVFDGTPKAIAERRTEKNAEGKITKYIPAAYLTEAFDKPVLFIGELGEKLGRSIGLKADWYCLCLDADAHHFRKEHAIFNGPFAVKMTIQNKPTPSPAFHYEYFLGTKTPDTVAMWKVQTKGYESDKYFRIGMVARPWGFEDSPDAEYISSGVCQKTLDAVALGRHGNYFHWGFAASPEYMTSEGQTVLANAIAYISKFDGKGIIARKYLDRRATREYLKELKYLSTRASLESRIESNKEFDKRMLAEKAAAEIKQGKGEKLAENEVRSLSYKIQPVLSFEEYLKRYQKALYDSFGTNQDAYARYFDENKDYFYSEEDFYVMTVDEDVKSLGIPYYDKRLLDVSISMLEKGKDVEKAKRILDRYTMANFNTPAEWRKWYETNKNRMFFTETGGYYFMIDTYDKNIEGNDYKRKQQRETVGDIEPAKTDHNNPVSIATAIIDKGNNVKEIVIKFRIHPGYHLYAFVSDSDPYVNTDIQIEIPEGYTKKEGIKMPSFQYFNESGTTIYTDDITFIQEIMGSGSGEAVCLVSYQCCDTQICFPPVSDKKLVVKIN